MGQGKRKGGDIISLFLHYILGLLVFPSKFSITTFLLAQPDITPKRCKLYTFSFWKFDFMLGQILGPNWFVVSRKDSVHQNFNLFCRLLFFSPKTYQPFCKKQWINLEWPYLTLLYKTCLNWVAQKLWWLCTCSTNF